MSNFPDPLPVLQKIVYSAPIPNDDALAARNIEISKKAKELKADVEKALKAAAAINIPTPSIPKPTIPKPEISGLGGVDQFLPSIDDLIESQLPFWASGIIGGVSAIKDKINTAMTALNDTAGSAGDYLTKIDAAEVTAKQQAAQKLVFDRLASQQ